MNANDIVGGGMFNEAPGFVFNMGGGPGILGQFEVHPRIVFARDTLSSTEDSGFQTVCKPFTRTGALKFIMVML